MPQYVRRSWTKEVPTKGIFFSNSTLSGVSFFSVPHVPVSFAFCFTRTWWQTDPHTSFFFSFSTYCCFRVSRCATNKLYFTMLRRLDQKKVTVLLLILLNIDYELILLAYLFRMEELNGIKRRALQHDAHHGRWK